MPPPDLPRSTLGPMDPMPEPGDLVDAFSPQAGRCFRIDPVGPVAGHPLPRGAGVERDLDGSEVQKLVRGGVP
jgi:hypothetical protein